ncbi:helix-turn-helix transcriptional regulator [Streptomyces sp. TRM 70361]|uniref:helix-turn-helix transcriptional regulator n=1 Tax=Streptomyces sp. TRM 70361 TaxID=3116553 RepID=UPI002E7ADAE1|nr:helix-turn-helix transcriptional regulator [Streptomyces sp. TRM 70361]MEE1939663.1 helix-turn-helix transcriptional regulator [Streptomyces sp. TRM 70361]
MRGETTAQMIRRLREGKGWSQARLAREVCRAAGVGSGGLGRQEIYRYEKGLRTPCVWLPFLAAALEVPVTELERAAATKADEAAPASVADFLPEGDPLAPLQVRHGRRIGAGTVEDVQRRVHGLRLADDVIAGGDLLKPALRELRSAVRLYRESSHSEETGRTLLVAIGELAQIAGWIASDAGEHEQAEKIYRLGISAAHQAGDRTLVGNLLGSLAYQRTNTGDVRGGLVMARTALEEAGEDAPPRARALYLDRVAWAHTKAGEPQEAVRALGEAGETLTEHGGEDEPGYLYWVDRGELEVMEARVYTELHRPLRAVPLLREVLTRYDATHARELALYLSWLAVALADANEPEEAAATAERVLTLSADVASERTAERSRVVLARLSEYRDVPEVRDLLGRAA